MTRILLRAGFASAIGAVTMALLAPLEERVAAFLVVLALWTAVSWLTWRGLSREPGPGAEEGSRAALVLAVAAFLRVEQDARINNPGLTAIYPPLALAAFRAVAAVSPDARAQKGFFALCDLLVCALLMRLLRRRGLSAAWAALYAWHPLLIVEFAAAGHLDSLMILGLLAGLELWESGRRELGAVAWAAAALVKVVPVIVLPWLFLRHRRFAALFLFAAAIGILPAVPGLAAALRAAPESGIAAFVSDWLANPSLYAILSPFVESPAARRLLLAAAVGAFSLFWARRCGEDPARFLGGMILAVLLASPVVQPWYVLWALPLSLLSPSRAALAWSWVVGFMYLAVDPALKAASAGLPWWHWLWIGEYALVCSLLVIQASSSRGSAFPK